MTAPAIDPVEMILRQCAAAAPQPWYPSDYVRQTGTSRDQLDPHLDRLRLGGLVHLTDWVEGRGQGYALTPEGTRVLQSPRDLAKLLAGKLSHPAAPADNGRAATHWHGTAWERGEAVRDVLHNPQSPAVTPVLLLLNGIVFLTGLVLAAVAGVPPSEYMGLENLKNLVVFQLDPRVEHVQHLLGALSGRDLAAGQWWRLLSCCFVHFGLVHLGVNMYTLYVVGPLLEQIWGRWRFLLLYLVTGIGGSCAMVLSSPFSTGAGASGALWGLVASLATWVVLNRRFMEREFASAWLRRLTIVLVLNGGLSMIPGISAAAHFGGGAVGVAAALLLTAQRFGRGVLSKLALAGVLALPVVGVGTVLVFQRFDPRWQRLDWADWHGRHEPQMATLWNESLDLEITQVDPVLRHAGRRPDPQAVQEALTALSAARRKLDLAAEVVNKAGPYTNADTEAERTHALEILAVRAEHLDAVEYQGFYFPKFQHVEESALPVYAEAEPFLKLLVTPGDQKIRVTALTGELDEEAAQLAQVADQFHKAGPYRNLAAEQSRQRVVNVLQAQARLFGLAARRLRKPMTWTAADEREFVRQERVLKKFSGGKK